MKRILLSGAIGCAVACFSASAFAHADIGVFFGFPGPVIETPPPVVYEQPPVVYEPAPVYYGPYYDEDYRYRRHWHDHGWHHGWRHRGDNEDDDD
ncbi:MAG: hypothetical protein EPN70_07275 [Paraburkholderia sp.]|uniref:hypothetical protein n=1 Tax=Paraburkholderia sp. TaxID=1926495 RepID=UPI00121EC22C|nr:hypothetical protein [Paraburkholderia sp.]TAM05827.1 MAG: hypothetical protein EPN70_07275 [Paraburkholderia sp.]